MGSAKNWKIEKKTLPGLVKSWIHPACNNVSINSGGVTARGEFFGRLWSIQLKKQEQKSSKKQPGDLHQPATM